MKPDPFVSAPPVEEADSERPLEGDKLGSKRTKSLGLSTILGIAIIIMCMKDLQRWKIIESAVFLTSKAPITIEETGNSQRADVLYEMPS